VADYEFAYTALKQGPSNAYPSGKTIHRPVLQVQLAAVGGSVSCLAVADTGADHCIFPHLFLAPLGLDPLKLKMDMTGGVGSMANPTYYADISISFKTTCGTVLTFKTLAGFTAAMDPVGFGLLGQDGFFETYLVAFDHQAKKFLIQTS
jgi:hypothetical protein